MWEEYMDLLKKSRVLSILFSSMIFLFLYTNKTYAVQEDNAFIPLNTTSPVEKEEVEGLLGEYFSNSYRFCGGDSGFPNTGSFQALTFEKDGQTLPLKKWPKASLTYKNNTLILNKDGQKKVLAKDIKPAQQAGWPDFIYVDVADIDFDNEPDFFVLTYAAGSGSNGYDLLHWDRKTAQGLALFVPFSPDKFPSSPDKYGEHLFFSYGGGPNPNFIPEKRMLEFIGRVGPFYDSERWCFDDGQYYLCEKIKQTYHANADNMCELERRVRFDKQGNVTRISMHQIEDKRENAQLRFMAAYAMPVFANTNDDSSPIVTLNAGDIVDVLDYKVVNATDHSVLIWFQVRPEKNNNITGWCCAFLKTAFTEKGKLYIHGDPDYQYNIILGVRRTDNGAELLVTNGKDQIVVPNVLVMYNVFNNYSVEPDEEQQGRQN